VSGIKVYNNTVFNNTHSGIATDATVSNSIIRNNVLYQNGQPIADLGSGTIQSNNLTADPKFIDGAANNFRLQSSSPAINAGVSLSEVLTDFDGIPRPQGSAFDIGSYEYR
jgi:parallel beta-helix repeat protein